MTLATGKTDLARSRVATYMLVAAGMLLGSFVLRGSTWQGSTQLHTLMEAIATLLALMVGTMALVRFYAKKSSTFLFVGGGFLGTAFLDGYHAVVTSTFFAGSFPSLPSSLIPWSWIASRMFLSVLLAASWWAWRREARGGEAARINDRAVYAFVAAVTVASLLFFAFVPLPRAYYPEFVFHRPEEFLPAFFFLIALIGYLRKGAWKTDPFDHWLVLSLLVALLGQTIFMSFSGQLFDGMFDLAHLLKKATYILVLTGLEVSMYGLFRLAELQRAEEALAESEQRYRTLVEVSPEVIAVHCAGTIVFTNEAGASLLGASGPDEIIGRPTLDFVHPDFRQVATDRIRQTSLGGAPPQSTEIQMLRMDGRPIDAEMLAAPISYQGRPARLLLARDISVRKRAEQALLITQQRLVSILEIAADAIISIDDAQTIVFFNREAENIFGYAESEILGEPLDMLLPERFREVHAAHLADFAASSEPSRRMSAREQIWGRRDGSKFPAEASLSKVEVAGMAMLTVIVRDITERKRAEAAVSAEHARTEQLLTSISSVLIGVHLDGTVHLWNRAAELTFGVPAQEAEQRQFRHCPIRWDWEQMEHAIAQSMQSGCPVRINELRFTSVDGSDGFLGLSVNPVAGEAGAQSGYLIAAVDVTERRVLEGQLSQAQKLESLGQLAAGIAHEINTPTQYVGDNVRFLQEAFEDLDSLLARYAELAAACRAGSATDALLGELDGAAEEVDLEYLHEEIPRATTQSLEGVGRVANIVRAMKEFSHPGTDEKTAVDINQAIASTITVARNEWKYVAEMETDFDPTLPPVPCLPGDFNQVILNMITNAAHAIADRVGLAPRSRARSRSPRVVKTRRWRYASPTPGRGSRRRSGLASSTPSLPPGKWGRAPGRGWRSRAP